MKCKTYVTHDNGERPFTVEICGKTVTIHSNNGKHVPLTVISKKTFVGHSPVNDMTLFSGGYGPNFKGNSILLELGPYIYLYVGQDVTIFSTYYPIKKYVSPVGNNDVPYPYAIDEIGNIYLIVENVVLLSSSSTRRSIVHKDPYDYFYTKRNITVTENMRRRFKRPDVHFMGINAYFINGEEYTMNYSVEPEKHWGRITGPDFIEEGDVVPESKKGVFVRYDNGIVRKLSLEDYKSIMREFSSVMGFEKMKSRVIIPRS